MPMDHSPKMFDEQAAQLPLWSDRDSTDGWAFRESRRARRLTVRVFHSGRVEVVVPSRTTRTTVERFLERHRPWIEKKRAEAK
jgi:predicted metal-dependent hydrolase